MYSKHVLLYALLRRRRKVFVIKIKKLPRFYHKLHSDVIDDVFFLLFIVYIWILKYWKTINYGRWWWMLVLFWKRLNIFIEIKGSWVASGLTIKVNRVIFSPKHQFTARYKRERNRWSKAIGCIGEDLDLILTILPCPHFYR